MSLKLTRTAQQPVLTIESEVRYRTLRHPTVIERMVLRLILAATREPRLADQGLAAAFETELGLAEAERLIEPAVRSLCDVRLLNPPVDLHALSLAEGRAVMNTPLGEWRLDPRAESYLARGQIPRRAMVRTLRHVFDPISQALQPAGSAPSERIDDRTAPALRLPIAEPTLEDLGERVRAHLPEERHGWLTPDTEILEVRSGLPQHAWQPVRLEITVARDGTVTVAAPQSPSVQRWLGQAEPEPLWPLLSELLSARDKAVPPGAEVRPQELTALEPPSLAREPKPRQLDLHAPAHAADPLEVIEWLDHRPRQLSIPRPAALPPSWTSMRIPAPGEPPQIGLTGRMQLHWAGQPRTVPVQGWMNPQDPQAVEVVTQLAQSVFQTLARIEAPAAEVMRLWFETPAQVLQAWDRHADSLDDAARMESLARLLEEMARRLPPARIAAEAAFGTQHQALLSRRSPIDDEAGRQRHLAATCTLLQALRTWPQPLHARATDRLIEQLPPLQQLAEARDLRQVLGNDALSLPTRLLSPTLREDLLEAELDGQPSGCGPHGLAEPIRQFGQHWKQIRRDIDPVLLESTPNLDAPSPEWRHAVIRRIARLEAAVQAGRQHIDTLSQSLGLMPARLSLMDARLGAIAQWLQWHLAPALPHAEPVRVLDTSVLMARPDLLDRVPDTLRLVLPRRVIQELDGLKRAEPLDSDGSPERARLAAQARAAIAAIERHQSRLIHEPDHPELWPENTMSNDQCILSAALFWARSEVRLWSADRNLRNLAQSCGVAAEDAPRFEPTPSGARAARPSKSETRR